MLHYTVFITGANRGLGLEFVRQYASDNWRVLASCRNLVQAKELQHLAQYFPNITLLQLDVTNPIQLHQIADKYADTGIDLLINNAGVYFTENLGEISVESMKQAFLVNAVAPLKIAETFLPHLSSSYLKTIVSISSELGSINNNHTGGTYSFRASKAALNMTMKSLAINLKDRNIKVFTLHPGSVKTATGGPNAVLRLLLLRLTERESGNFYDYQGHRLNW
jgi:NAD(P)-dependent dehydrogenase (short-subunit alcohol dehydrogenase family)